VSNNPIQKVRVLKKRKFTPHHILIGVAEMALEDAETNCPGYSYKELTAITFLALALEAIANAFGEKFVADWDDFEKSNPIAKLRIICAHLKVDADFKVEPWITAKWLVKVRNKIVHARPEMINFDKTMTKDESEKIRRELPPSKLEKEINLKNARRAIKNVKQIQELFISKISLEDFDAENLFSDGFSGSISPC
jgi:hypothetical protein